MKNLSCLLLVSFFLFSCEKEISLPVRTDERKGVVNAILCADSLIHTLSLSFTCPITENCDKKIDTESPKLQIDERECPTEPIGNNRFLAMASQPLSFQSKVSLHSAFVGIPTVHAEEEVPCKPQITGIKFHWEKGETAEKDKLHFDIKIGKQAHPEYFRILLWVKTDYKGSSDNKFIQCPILPGSDPLFVSPTELLDEMDKRAYYIFSRQGVITRDYLITPAISLSHPDRMKENTWGIEIAKVEVKIELQGLSPSLYHYMVSLLRYRESSPFSEPVKLYSNVHNGYGILGIYNPTSRNQIVYESK